MAINFLNDVSFNKNEIIQPVLENQTGDVAAGTPIDGQLYYDTTNNVVKYGEGGSWIALSASTPGNGTLSITAGNGLSGSNFTFTANQSGNTSATLTVGEGTGISVASGSVGIDYVGTDNAILAATATTPAGADTMWFSDSDDNTIKKATITNILALAPQGDITAVEASTDNDQLGIEVVNGTGPVPEVGLNIIGQTNLGATPAQTDELIIYDLSSTTNKSITVANLVAAAPQGDITNVSAGNGLTGGGSSGSVTLNVGAGAGIKVGSNDVAVDYSSSGVVNDANDGTSVTLVDSDEFIFEDVGSTASTAVKRGTLSQLKTYIGAGTYTWTVAGDSGSSTVSSGQTVTINGSGTGVNAGIDVTESSRTVTVKLDLGELTTNSTIDGANDEIAFYDSNATGNAKIAPVDIHLDQFGAAESNISMGGNQIDNLADPTAAQDAATKAYVDSAVTGLVEFKGGFNANTGAIDGTVDNLTSGGSRVAVQVGDMYIVTTAGDFYGDASAPLTVGDSVIAKLNAAAGTSDINDWTIVQGDEGVVNLTNSNGTFVSFGTTNTNARGAVTLGSVDLSASGSPSSSNFLRGDNQWATPTDTNTEYDFLCSQNSGSNSDPFLTLKPSSGSDDQVQLRGGTNITVTRTNATQLTIATSATTNTGTVESVGITDGYLIDSSGTNPVTTTGNIQVDVDMSELTDMGATLSSSDEAVILDVSETGKDQAKRITWAEVISDLGLATGASVNNSTITLSAGEGLNGGGSFTLNQASNATISFSGEDSTSTNKGIVIVAPGEGIDVSYASGTATVSGENSTASNKGIVIVAGGAGIDVSYSSGTATVSNTDGSTGGATVVLADATGGVVKSTSGGFTLYTITTATVFGATTDGRAVMAEVQDTSSYATVFTEVERTATTVVIKFKGSITDSDYRALLYSVAN